MMERRRKAQREGSDEGMRVSRDLSTYGQDLREAEPAHCRESNPSDRIRKALLLIKLNYVFPNYSNEYQGWNGRVSLYKTRNSKSKDKAA